ncbi:MAG: hypothetical protein BMS9Abin28_0021 [Anaerolineae bacterium]|nr:MAG: hypothetical protein BMS9Abin28_0021 [Anaerolineae bacterium]
MVILGYAIYSLLIAGFVWGLVDMLVQIHKQPKRPLSVLRLTSYPFVPDDETLQVMREKQRPDGKLEPSPVPVRINYR